MQARVVGMNIGEDRWGKPIPDGEMEFTLVVRVQEDSPEGKALFAAGRSRGSVGFTLPESLSDKPQEETPPSGGAGGLR